MRPIKTDTREKKALRQAFLRFLPIPVVLILLSSVLISYSGYDNRKQEIMLQQREQTVTAMISFRNYVSYLTSITRTVETDILDMADDETTAQPYEALLQSCIRQFPVIDSLRLLYLNVMETVRVSQVSGSPTAAPADELRDLSGWDFFQETETLSRYQYLYSNLAPDAEQGYVVLDPDTGVSKPVLRISTPLELDGVRLGYFIAGFLMRDNLETLRTSLGMEGCYVLIMDENGSLYNAQSDTDNFGILAVPGAPQTGRTIDTLFPGINLSAGSGSYAYADRLCSFSTYENIYDRSIDYLLSKSAPRKMVVLVYYDGSSAYAHELQYSYIYYVVRTWNVQLAVCAGILIAYLLALLLIFLYDRLRFTDLFSDNRYPKALLKQAIKSHQFVNYYQPIINIQNKTVMGFETLSRWHYHDQLLPPSMFINEVFHYQLGQMLDENVFLTVRKDRKRMEQHEGFQDTFISINCCQQTFSSLILEPPATLISLTEEEKKYIVLELLENIVFNQNTQDRIRELYRHNIIFAIDDFGTGNSNIAFIRNFENLKVKIDRAFVPVDPTDTKDRVIIEAFVKMFVDQGLRLIVEGAESREQIEYLKTLGVAGVQGYYFSHPMTIDRLIEYVDNKEYLKKL